MHKQTASSQWLSYFRAHKLREPSWESTDSLPLPIGAIASLHDFQRGEKSEGHHFSKLADKYAEDNHDPAYAASVRHLIREENHHAYLLERYLIQSQQQPAEASGLDQIFRFLRHALSLQGTISVLVSAEILALVYYSALEQATSCPALKRLCVIIYEDELAHIRFQMQQLHRMRVKSKRRGVAEFLHTTLYFGTSLALWLRHHRFFRHNGLPLSIYMNRVGKVWQWASQQTSSASSTDQTNIPKTANSSEKVRLLL